MKDFPGSTPEAVIVVEQQGATATSGTRPRTLYRRFGKRILDIALAVVAVPFALPFVAVCAVAVAIDGGSPFYRHQRVGQHGRLFWCWKIRSMVVGSDQKLVAHLEADPEARAEWDRSRKLLNDPRVTPFGRFLRRSSIDELPQLLNGLAGDMSIVGPRPVVPEELDLYGSRRTAYLELRPGITGLWQVSGRNEVAYAQRVALDQEYRDTCSLWCDTRIILKTCRVLWTGNGK